MKNNLYDSIATRKSTRKYDMTPLNNNIIEELQKYADELVPLIPSISYEFGFLQASEVNNILQVKAPHYICIYSETQEGYLMNVGYLMQQIDLYLSANNLGSCWLGMAKPNKKAPAFNSKDQKKFVILIGFGKAEIDSHRTSNSQFKRKGLSEITNISDSSQLLEPVRIAPSGINSQPWFFSGTVDDIIVSRENLSFLKEPVYGKMNQIDIGIALCHLQLSLEHMGKSVSFDFRKETAQNGYEFMVRVKSKEMRE